jgi:serine/threonine protein kinase
MSVSPQKGACHWCECANGFVVYVTIVTACIGQQPERMPMQGVHNIEPGAARLISKLLVKDPTERWSAHKALHSQFFWQR